MSVDKTPTGVVYTVTSGAAGQQYPLTFPYIKGADVKAYYVQAGTQTSLTYGTHYTVADQTFTASVALPTGAKLAIYRQTDLTQEILWKDGQAVYTPDIMKADDKLTLIAQEISADMSRTVKLTREEEAAGGSPETVVASIYASRDAAAASETAAAAQATAAQASAQEAANSANTAAQTVETAAAEAVNAATAAAAAAQIAGDGAAVVTAHAAALDLVAGNIDAIQGTAQNALSASESAKQAQLSADAAAASANEAANSVLSLQQHLLLEYEIPVTNSDGKISILLADIGHPGMPKPFNPMISVLSSKSYICSLTSRSKLGFDVQLFNNFGEKKVDVSKTHGLGLVRLGQGKRFGQRNIRTTATLCFTIPNTTAI